MAEDEKRLSIFVRRGGLYAGGKDFMHSSGEEKDDERDSFLVFGSTSLHYL